MPPLAKCEAGNVIVEFALLAAPLLLMIFGFFELGRYFFINDALADAARDAARFAIVRGSASDAPATVDDVTAMVRNKAPAMAVPTKLDVSVRYQPNNSPGSKVLVQVTYPMTLIFPGFAVLGPLTLTKTASMTISR